MPWFRAVAAFLVAPAVGILTAWLIAFCLLAMPFEFTFSLVPLAYGLMLVVGIPAFLLAHWLKLGLTALWGYAIVGFLIACCVAVPVWFVGDIPTHNISALIALSGFTAGLAFGLIWRPKSNNRWRGP